NTARAIVFGTPAGRRSPLSGCRPTSLAAGATRAKPTPAGRQRTPGPGSRDKIPPADRRFAWREVASAQGRLFAAVSHRSRSHRGGVALMPALSPELEEKLRCLADPLPPPPSAGGRGSAMNVVHLASDSGSSLVDAVGEAVAPIGSTRGEMTIPDG